MNKPPYKVPSMDEIAAIPWNGFNAVSTFSGCGGSSLGYKMAGFRILWANEFIPAAQDTYRANHKSTILDIRDIRTVHPDEILSAIGMKAGELDLFDGSPPCASFSTAGKREAGWGKVKAYSDTKQRTDDLFFEYTRLLQGLQPKTFVAENVSGLVKGTAKGYFLEILAALKDCGYNVKAKLLDAQWLGVPQMRQRVIFVGVRNDFRLAPVHPSPLPYRYSVRDAIGNVTNTIDEIKCASSEGYEVGRELNKLKPGQQSERYFGLHRASWDAPSGCVTVEGKKTHAASVAHPERCGKFTIPELKRIGGFPDDFVLTGTYAQQWERIGRAVPPVMMMYIAAAIRDEVLCKLK